MKLLGVFFALSFTGSLLASPPELIAFERENVREALIDALNRHDLNCQWEGVARPSDRMMADVIKQILMNDSARFYADETSVRPKIIVKRPTNYRDLNYVEMNFNTTFDQEAVEFIELYEGRIRLERQNVGTIFNPRFEMVEIHDQLLAGRCDLY